MAPAISDYEAQRLKNIENNKALLQSIGLTNLFPTNKAVKAKPPPRKRKTPPAEVDSPQSDRRKSVRLDPDVSLLNEDGVRRSLRNAGKKVDYNAEQDRSVRSVGISKGRADAMGSEPRSVNKRLHDPKQFGHIPGIPVGSWWETREACSLDAVHAPWVAGISGSPKGAYSVALSGGYDDDVDLGYAFTYTGSGGRDLKGTKDKPKNLRTAPQSSDQTFENSFNKALKISAETKRPIRVIRGFKLQSQYAPSEGYRYDGLYTVEKAWTEKGLNPQGYLVCKFAFKRLEGQPAIPERDLEAEANERDAQDDGTSDAENGGQSESETSGAEEPPTNGNMKHPAPDTSDPPTEKKSAVVAENSATLVSDGEAKSALVDNADADVDAEGEADADGELEMEEEK
ncbi:hypothetical protein BD410DRAFT_224072 [Rickenella mellea]|uniref:YDG domain-containing protein n=1 Tax=Rickenella mellea TaxID=50990 RepID=A0A4Y7QM84_9AGAM|nr:hypothetical protein BD410DRAFT_224072 [Rickenella mellea]